MEFLNIQFEDGLGYSAINTARSALSSLGIIINGFSVGSHPLIIRFLKGVFNLRPSMPRYTCTWNVDDVLQYLRTLSPVKDLTLKDLTLKLVMLIALLCAARVQSLHCLKVDNMVKKKSSFIFTFSDLLKTSRPKFHVPEIVLNCYPPDRRLCVYTVMSEYLVRTETLRGNETVLFISYVKPHKKVTRDSIARWIKTVMARAGIDITVFKAHSTRSAAVSKVSSGDVPVSEILSKAGWSSDCTFRKYYDKNVMCDNKFEQAVLKL